MSDTPGPPAIRWSADHKRLVVSPGVESGDFRLRDPVADPGATALIALQAGTGRFVTRGFPPGGGDVAGPAGATDNAVVRFDGPTGKLVQDSPAVAVTDGGLLAFSAAAGGLALPNPPATSTDGVLRNGGQYLALAGVAWRGPWAPAQLSNVVFERLGNRVFVWLDLGAYLNDGPNRFIETFASIVPSWALPIATRNGGMAIVSGNVPAVGSWVVRTDGVLEIRPSLATGFVFPGGSTGLSGVAGNPSLDFFYYAD
jgi:hypothetical protein